MTIHVNFNCESVSQLHDEMLQLLSGSTSLGRVTAEPQTGASGGVTGKPATGRGRGKAAAAEQQAISTGEERNDPAAEQQDAKDEAADTAKEKAAEPEPTKLTHDDVKKVLGGYVAMYGMEAAQADGEGFIGVSAISKLPEDQASLAKAILAVANGIEKNPNNRDIAGDGISKEKIEQLKPIIAAAKAVK